MVADLRRTGQHTTKQLQAVQEQQWTSLYITLGEDQAPNERSRASLTQHDCNCPLQCGDAAHYTKAFWHFIPSLLSYDSLDGLAWIKV